MEKVMQTETTNPTTGQSSQPTQTMNPNTQSQPVIKKMPTGTAKKNFSMVVIAILVVLAGVGTGWKLSGVSACS